MTKPIRTRFAPSPTGYLHIGGLRTALYSYAFAKRNGGTTILRIEDTDRTRYIEGATEALVKTLATMGLMFDEGPVKFDALGKLVHVGTHGPYIQSERLHVYKAWVHELLEQGSAYPCFCTPERLETMRAEQSLAKQATKYDRHCLQISKEEQQIRLINNEPHVVRLRIPEGETIVEDAVYGSLRFPNADIDDQVLMKSDGFPTYHLAVVVDDHLMEITHVLRGEDWLPSTPKQVILYNYFGWEVPIFGHLPNLLNPDRKKLSKRQGDVAVEDFLAKGYLPEALLNFVGTLGFNPSGEQELYSIKELTESFDLSKVNRSGAIVNGEKLDWMNKQYIQRMTLDELLKHAELRLQQEGIVIETEQLQRILKVEQSRFTTLNDIVRQVVSYLSIAHYDPELLIWKKANKADAKQQLKDLRDYFSEKESVFFQDAGILEVSLRTWIEQKGIPIGNVLWPLRVALSQAVQSPSPFELLWIFGKMESLARIDYALTSIS